MKNRDNDEVLDKKVRARLREDILNEINTTVKEELVNTVVSDVKQSFDQNYKNEIKEEITNDIKTDIKSDIEETFKKDQKRISRKKSFKIFRLNIYVILLIVCSLFLMYRLYETGNFEIKVVEKNKETETTTTTTTKVVHDLNWLKNKYSKLINNVNITNIELLKGTYDVKDISIEDKLAMSYSILGETDKVSEGIIIKVSKDKLESAYNKIFSDDNYKNANFTYNSLNFAYSDNNSEYIAVGEEAKKYKIVNDIYDIKEDKNIVVISIYVAVLNNDNVYGINDLENAIKEGSSDISDITDKLDKVDYTFEYSNGDFHLIKIEKK